MADGVCGEAEGAGDFGMAPYLAVVVGGHLPEAP